MLRRSPAGPKRGCRDLTLTFSASRLEQTRMARRPKTHGDENSRRGGAGPALALGKGPATELQRTSPTAAGSTALNREAAPKSWEALDTGVLTYPEPEVTYVRERQRRASQSSSFCLPKLHP